MKRITYSDINNYKLNIYQLSAILDNAGINPEVKEIIRQMVVKVMETTGCSDKACMEIINDPGFLISWNTLVDEGLGGILVKKSK